MQHLRAALGLFVFFGIAWALSEDRRAARVRVAVAGITAQVVLAALLLKVDLLRAVFALLGDGVAALQAASEAGTGMVFGYLGGATLPLTSPLRSSCWLPWSIWSTPALACCPK